MSTMLDNPSLPDFQEFADIYGEELDDCNPNAYDLLQQILSSGDKKLIEDFMWYYLDELDACHPDAFDFLYEVAEKHEIPM